MKKILSVVLVVLIVVVSFTGCGGRYDKLSSKIEKAMIADGFPLELAMLGGIPDYNSDMGYSQYTYLQQEKKVSYEEIVSFYRTAVANLGYSVAVDAETQQILEQGLLENAVNQAYIDAGYKAWVLNASNAEGTVSISVQVLQGLVERNIINDVGVIYFDFSGMLADGSISMGGEETGDDMVSVVDDLAEQIEGTPEAEVPAA